MNASDDSTSGVLTRGRLVWTGVASKDLSSGMEIPRALGHSVACEQRRRGLISALLMAARIEYDGKADKVGQLDEMGIDRRCRMRIGSPGSAGGAGSRRE
jgi:hypothetical protein